MELMAVFAYNLGQFLEFLIIGLLIFPYTRVICVEIILRFNALHRLFWNSPVVEVIILRKFVLSKKKKRL